MIRLLWAIHNHQPVGNFDFIFERAHDRAYRPFLDVLKAHPKVSISLHFSGILIDWLEKHRPDYIRDVRSLCESGQLEILGGAYYEPILPMLSDRDKEGQISKLSRKIEKLFGNAPRGMWLAERVWEPSLVAPIARCGIEYVVLDGSHFKMVGKTDADLNGYFDTEDQGYSLKLFPIHDAVRDTIPFRGVEEVISSLHQLNTQDEVQVVFGDDGEKFGDWPQTFDTVYTHGWLDRFFSAIEAAPESFSMQPLSSGLTNAKNLGLVYLQPASYQDMMVWAQNAADVPRFRGLQNWLQESGRGEDADRFLRGTFWRNFLTKYPESNRIHKQGLRLSKVLDKHRSHLDSSLLKTAQDHLWQSQCNCAYWHGVFGGLYLPHLRFALYRELIAAQKQLDALCLNGESHSWESSDWNFDGRAEHLLNTEKFFFAFTADGAVDQFWLKKTGINLCDTLTRRSEAYHAFIISGPQGGTKLENQIVAKEEGLQNFLIYDRRIRETFSEWLLPAETPFDVYQRQDFSPALQVHFGSPKLQASATGVRILFKGEASLNGGGKLRAEKAFSLPNKGDAVDVQWRFSCHGGAVSFRFVAEALFCLLAGNAPDRYVSWKDGAGKHRDILASNAEMPAVHQIGITDEWLGLSCAVEAKESLMLWRTAIETVSQSEGGYERVYQGTVIAPVWDFNLSDGDKVQVHLKCKLKERNTGW